jgi:proliferating cell nuclear antigen PCNA
MRASFGNESGVRCSDIVSMLKGIKGFALDVVTLRLSSTGMYVQGMDNSHACLFEYKIALGDIETYTFVAGKDAPVVAVSAVALDKALQCYHSGQHLSLDTSGLDPTQLRLSITGGPFAETIIMVPLHCVEGEELMDIPVVDYDVDVTLSSRKLAVVVEQMGLFGTRVALRCSEDDMVWTCSGEAGCISVKLDQSDPSLEYAVVEGIDIKQTYSVRFLKLVLGLHSLRDEVYVGVSENVPLTIKYNLVDSGMSCANFYIAPCLTD